MLYGKYHEYNFSGGKQWYHKDISLEEIGLNAQNVLTILGSIINMIGGTYMTT